MRPLFYSSLCFVILATSACASLPFGKNRETTAQPAEEEALPPPSQTPTDGTDRIEKSNMPQPKKKGFFSKLARNLGSDSNTSNVGPCPAVRVLYEASRFVELDGPERFENVGYTGEIQNVVSNCRYIQDDPIEVALQIQMAIGRGPKASGEYKDVKYWVAVTRKDIAPMARQNFTGRVNFPQGSDRVALTTPQITINIPRAHGEISGSNFEVIIGYDLTEAQLNFNRDGKRFRVDAGVPK